MAYTVLRVCVLTACIIHATSECSNNGNNEHTLKLNNCSLDTQPFMKCFISGRDGANNHWRKYQEVHFKLTFRVLDVDHLNLSTVRRCITLSNAALSLFRDFNLNYTDTFQLPVPFLRFSSILKSESYLEVVQNKTTPMGFIDLDSKCTESWRTGSKCIQNVEIHLSNILQRTTADSLSMIMDMFSGSLGMEILRLRLVFDHHIVSKFRLEGVGAKLSLNEKTEEVRISHGTWNRVQGIPWNMSKLTHLEVTWNQIELIETGWIRSLKHLQYMSLAHNELQTVPEDIHFLQDLTYLDLSFNPIILQDNTLSWIPNTAINLSLASVPIASLRGLLPLDEPSKPVILSQLDVSFCNLSLSEGDEVMFHSQYLLEVLNMSHNLLHFIPTNTVRGLYKLRILDLSHNFLKRIPSIDISGHVLHTLDVSWNQLEDIGDFLEKGTVYIVNLSHNKIKSWENSNEFNRYSTQHLHVASLDLSHNMISSFSPDMTLIMSQIKAIDLGANPINCYECSTREFQVWLSRTNSVIVLGSSEPLLCAFPEGIHGSQYPVVEFGVPDNRCYKKSIIPPTTAVSVIIAAGAAIIIFIMFISIMCYSARYDFSYSVHLLAIKKKWKISLSRAGLNYDAFISYSEEDYGWVMTKLVSGMECPPYNLKVSLRHRDVPLGSAIVEGVIRLIYNSRNTVVVLSHNYIDSQWCRAEMEHVRRAGHNVVFLEKERLERWRLSREIRYLMDTRIYLPWQEGEERPWVRVAEALAYKKKTLSKHLQWLKPFRK